MKYYVYAACYVACFISLVCCFTSDAVADDCHFAEYELGDAPAPQRIKATVRQPAIIYYELVGMLPINMIVTYEYVEFMDYYRWIAEGEYDKLIERMEIYLSNRSPCYLVWRNVDYMVRYQFMLASAYELKGEWKKALCLYALVYGEKSTDFEWAKIRILFGSGHKHEAFERACKEIGRAHV